jgi:serine/threonine-protein kinase
VPSYEILGELGRGGMGVVYQARQIKAGRLVALKMVLAGNFADPSQMARFRTEAEAGARLSHPNIVQVFEVGECQGRPFFSMEFCTGSLAGKLATAPLEPAEAAKLVQSLATAVEAAHQANIIHRDLKPTNILLAADGTPKISDFGLARLLDEVGHTQTGAVLGTPPYMAPEQARGSNREVGPATDVYALGAILYECLAGRPPFKAATTADTLLQVVMDEPVSPRQLQPRVPCDLETICLKCLEKEPARRYTSCQKLSEELRRWLQGEPIHARPFSVVERVYRWGRRNPVVAGLVSAVM